jgi:xanthine/uracil permease
MKFNLDDKLSFGKLLLYGLQWWAVALPCVIITGVVAARLHYGGSGNIEATVFYVRKLFVVTGVMSMAQVLFGHRLPLVIGPAAVLLVGIIASLASGADALYTAIFIGGALLAILGLSGLLIKIRRFFTPKIVVVILILISFTLSPTILRLLSGGALGAAGLVFGFTLLFFMVIINELFKGVCKALTVLTGLCLGSLVYVLLFSLPSIPPYSPELSPELPLFFNFTFDPGTVLAFLFCFLALTVNELGSVEAVGRLLKAPDMDNRLKRGTIFCGLGNMASGSLGVIGSVDFSLSAGIIMATSCASRYPMVVMGIALVACALFPKFVLLLSVIPDPVMGSLLLYSMVSQLSSGLSMLSAEKRPLDFAAGVTVGLPLMMGLIISFTPSGVFQAFPLILRPILGNGFVMGVLAVIFLEHVVFGRKKKDENPETD